MKIIVIIPARNESAKISEVIKEVIDAGFEALVVDDGSTDATAEISRQAGAKVISHLVNRGQGAALKTGLTWALNQDYEIIVFFDADGQMKVEEIGKVLAPVVSGDCEVVLGSRFLGRVENISLIKLFALKLALVFSRLATGLKITDVHNGFQAWKREALEKINIIQDRQAYASEILHEIAAKKLKYQEVPVTITYTDYSKKKGQSILNAFGILWDLLIKK